MNIKIISLTVLIFLTSRALSQDFLNLKRELVKENVPKKFGEITKVKEMNGFPFRPEVENSIFYTFPRTQKDGIFNAYFFFSKDEKCFEYIILGNNVFQKKTIAKYDNPASGYKRKKGELVWVDNKRKIEVDLSKTAESAAPAGAFSLDIHLTNRAITEKNEQPSKSQ